MRGQAVLQAVQAMGVENAPAEWQQQAAAFAPETMRQLRIKAGESMLGWGHGAAPADYDQTSVKDARKRTDDAKWGAIKAEGSELAGLNASLEANASRIAEAVTDATTRMANMVIQKLKGDAHLRNSAFNN